MAPASCDIASAVRAPREEEVIRKQEGRRVTAERKGWQAAPRKKAMAWEDRQSRMAVRLAEKRRQRGVSGEPAALPRSSSVASSSTPGCRPPREAGAAPAGAPAVSSPTSMV